MKRDLYSEVSARIITGLARISHTTADFCEVPWHFSEAANIGDEGWWRRMRCEQSDVFGSAWASG
jgi:hypothetical protein